LDRVVSESDESGTAPLHQFVNNAGTQIYSFFFVLHIVSQIKLEALRCCTAKQLECTVMDKNN
jgi:hypothetical protein